MENIYFESQAKTYKDKSHRGIFKWIRAWEKRCVLQFIKEKHFRNTLELGCGSGFYTEFISRQTDQMWVNEISKTMIDQVDLPVDKKVCADMTQIYFKERFDLICCIGALEFVQEPFFAIQNSSNWLDDDGLMLLMIPENSFLSRIYKWFHQTRGNKIHLFDKKQVFQILENSKIQIVKFSFVFPFNLLILGRRISN